jgi:hypothetical protein
MSQFLTTLKVEELDDTSNDGRGTWQLLAPLVYQSDLAQRTITVPEGFITDYASVPRIPITYLLAGDTAHPAAVVHDWLYTTHQFDRATSDSILKEAALTEGVPSWRANIIYAGVYVGGSGPYAADATKQPTLVKQELEKYENSVDVTALAGA